MLSNQARIFAFESGGREVGPQLCPCCQEHDIFVGNSLEFLTENPFKIACVISARLNDEPIRLSNGQYDDLVFPGEPIVISSEVLAGQLEGHISIELRPAFGLLVDGIDQFESDFMTISTEFFELLWPEDEAWEIAGWIASEVREAIYRQGVITTIDISYATPEAVSEAEVVRWQQANAKLRSYFSRAGSSLPRLLDMNGMMMKSPRYLA